MYVALLVRTDYYLIAKALKEAIFHILQTNAKRKLLLLLFSSVVADLFVVRMLAHKRLRICCVACWRLLLFTFIVVIVLLFSFSPSLFTYRHIFTYTYTSIYILYIVNGMYICTCHQLYLALWQHWKSTTMPCWRHLPTPALWQILLAPFHSPATIGALQLTRSPSLYCTLQSS